MPDIIIRGTGPCGLAAAAKLQHLGRRVLLQGRPRIAPRVPRLETVHSLDVIRHAFPGFPLDERSGLSRHEGGVSFWNDAAAGIPPGYLVEREVFDAALLRWVVAAGADVHWKPVPPNAPLTILATGRHGVLKRDRLVSWKQIALTGVCVAAIPTTDVWTESLNHGWLWALRAGSSLVVSLFVDPSAVRVSTVRTFRDALKMSRLGTTHAVSLVSEIVCCEVTPSSAQTNHSQALVLGDAALARDPLCAQGLNSAISDGTAGGIIAHEWMYGKVDPALATEFLQSRQRQGCTRHLREIGLAYASAERNDPYWSTRSQPAESRQSPMSAWHPDTTLELSAHCQFGSAPVLAKVGLTRQEVLWPDDAQTEPLALVADRPIRDFLPPAGMRQTARSLGAGWVQRGLIKPAQVPSLLRLLTDQRVLLVVN